MTVSKERIDLSEPVQWQVTELLQSCGYWSLLPRDNRLIFTRREDPNRQFPRYELSLKFTNGHLLALFHRDARQHRTANVDHRLFEELERMIAVLQAKKMSVPTNLVEELVRALKIEVLLGIAQRLRDRNLAIIRSEGLAKLRSGRKERGPGKEILVKRRQRNQLKVEQEDHNL